MCNKNIPPKTQFWSVRINELRLKEEDKLGFQDKYTLTNDMIIRKLRHRGYVSRATYQLESSDGGTPHWQCHIEFFKKMNKYQVKSILGLLKGEYWMPCVDREFSEAYCRKHRTRIAGPYTFPTTPRVNALEKIIEYV